MDDAYKNMLRLAAIIGSVALTVFFPLGWFVVGPVIGYSAFKIVDSGAKLSPSKEKRAEKKELKRQQRELKQQLRQNKERYYSKERGWKVEELPVDMVLHGGASPSAVLDAAGIEKLVSARFDGEGYQFSFKIDDADKASALARSISERGLNAKAMRSPEGGFVVVSDDPHVINVFAKEAFPRRNVTVEREVTENHQYIIEGVGSYDEAVEKFKKDRDGLKPVNSYVSVSDRVDGKGRTITDGAPLDKASIVQLPTGAYVITESTVTSESATVRIPGDLKDAKSIAAFAAGQLSSGTGGGSSEEKTVLSDATPEGVSRGDALVLADPESPVAALAGAGLNMYVVMDSAEELESVMVKGRLPEGASVVLGKTPPEGRFVFSKPLDELKSALALGVLPSVDGDSSAKVLAEQLRNDGYASAFVRGNISLEGGSVNGLQTVELRDRLANERLPKLDGKDIESWITDASNIKSVTFTVDVKTGEFIMKTQVGDTVNTVRYPVSDKEDMRRLFSRGTVPLAELKDLAMQIYPGPFRTYMAPRSSASVAPSSLFENPIRDFLGGRKPVRREMKPQRRGLKESIKHKLG